MELNRTNFREQYSELTDDELLMMHSSGTLTDVAYGALEAELTKRGIDIPDRPTEPQEIGQGFHQKLSDHWRGEASLASAFWLVGVIGQIIIFPLIYFLRTHEFQALVIIGALATIFYFIFFLVSVWRCSSNASWIGWTYLARVYVLLYIASIAYALISPFFI